MKKIKGASSRVQFMEGFTALEIACVWLLFFLIDTAYYDIT